MIQIDADYIRDTIEDDSQYTDAQVRVIRKMTDEELEDAVEGFLGDLFWREVHDAIDFVVREATPEPGI